MSYFVPPAAGMLTQYTAERPPGEGRYWKREDDQVITIEEPSTIPSKVV